MSQVQQTIFAGGMIAYPTETVWGLGVDASNESAIEKIFAVKGREFSAPISILVRDISVANEWVQISQKARSFLEIVWPGPVTVILPKKEHVSPLLTAQTPYLGLRCSDDPYAKELMFHLGRPITTTSANRSGETPALTKEELSWLPDEVQVVGQDNPGCSSRKGSTVLKIDENDEYSFYREGDLSREILLKVLHSLNISPAQVPKP